MTPTHLAAYIARGPSGLPAFDLDAVLDALKAERAKAPTVIAVGRLDAAIAEIEYTLNPCLNTLFEMRFAAERVARDVLALVEKTAETP